MRALLRVFWSSRLFVCCGFLLSIGLVFAVSSPVLAAGGSIGGTVTTTSATPISGITVTAMNYVADGNGGGFVAGIVMGETDAEGHYALTNLSPGNYRIEFRDTAPSPQYQHKFYENADSLETATDLTIAADSALTINMQLPATGQIRGRITDVAGRPILDASARLYVLDPTGWSKSNDVRVDAQGYYTWTGLYPHTYRIGFETPFFSTPRYQPQFFDQVGTLEQAADITLAVEAVAADVNGLLVPAANQIAGWVTNEQAVPLQNVRVWLWQRQVDG